MSALEFLKKEEWSMGSGQCPKCCGSNESWLGHPLHLDSKKIGHKSDCELALAIKETGGNTLFIGDFKSDLVYENFIDDQGCYGTRLKTKDGCPRIKANNAKFQQECDELLLKHLLSENSLVAE
jgi:hypothetical protein